MPEYFISTSSSSSRTSSRMIVVIVKFSPGFETTNASVSTLVGLMVNFLTDKRLLTWYCAERQAILSHIVALTTHPAKSWSSNRHPDQPTSPRRVPNDWRFPSPSATQTGVLWGKGLAQIGLIRSYLVTYLVPFTVIQLSLQVDVLQLGVSRRACCMLPCVIVGVFKLKIIYSTSSE
jgi:hypothetical protein